MGGSFAAAPFLFLYAAAFSLACVALPTGVGALLLFGAVQLTMIGTGIARGERLGPRQGVGVGVALLGLLGLTLPGATAPAPAGAALMATAGAAWGGYSILGRGAADPVHATAGYFLRAAPMGAALVGALGARVAPPLDGVALAVVSGARASGGGYVLWYAALRSLTATEASVVQLSVPVLAALWGIAALGESPSPRLFGAGSAILLGIALALGAPRAPVSESARER